MDLETAANPAGEGIADEIVSLPNPQEAQAPAVGAPEPEQGNDPLADLAAEVVTPEPDFEEVEIDGKKIKVSQEGKEYLLREADYRRKTMDLADLKRAAQTEKEQAQQLANLTREEFQATVTLQQLNTELAQYQQIDWRAWSEADPQAAQAARWDYDEKRQQHAQLSQNLAAHQQTRARQQEQEFATLRRECLETVKREIPNWSDEKREKLEAFAVKLGVPEADAKGIAAPWGYRLLHLADVGQQFIERQRAAAKMKAAATATPAPQVGGSSSGAAKDPAEMSMEEYRAWRAGQS